jgi:hypothetical protein
MATIWKTIIWRQFGASIEMLENAMVACPDEVWNDRAAQPEFWYLVYHTLFWLDLYLSGKFEGFAPPAPFTLDELDPAGVMPGRVYAKEELQTYLRHCRRKCRATIEGLTDEKARDLSIGWGDFTFAELLLDNMRHVQHHAAQLNLILRQKIDSAPGWIAKAKNDESDE